MNNNPSKENIKLPYLSQEERLEAYRLLTKGATHVWSKGELQEDRAKKILEILVPLAEKDPYFLAHLTSYIVKNSQSKDLKLLAIHSNSLSDADGSPFSPGSSYTKPNLRYVSAAGVQKLDPKLAYRVAELGRLKYSIDGILKESSHFPRFLRTALKKYLRYREENIQMLKGAKEAGLGPTVEKIYRAVHKSPTEEAAKALRWQQKDKEIEMDEAISFEGLADKEIAEKIREEEIPVLGALSMLSDKVSPVIAVALLEQATGNQAVILRRTFEEAGVLDDEEVMELYKERISEAKDSLDRVEKFHKQTSEKVEEVLKEAKGEKRKEATRGIGKIFLHLDRSTSMEEALEVAKNNASTIAEMVDKPHENFKWGSFSETKKIYELPDKFEQDAFRAILYGETTEGFTNMFALYPDAREFGAEVDVYITDGGHNAGNLGGKIASYHDGNPDKSKPKAVVLVMVGRWTDEGVRRHFESNGIPVAIITSEALSDSNQVSEAVRVAMEGPKAKIDEIMETELLQLPEWYYTI